MDKKPKFRGPQPSPQWQPVSSSSVQQTDEFTRDLRNEVQNSQLESFKNAEQIFPRKKKSDLRPTM